MSEPALVNIFVYDLEHAVCREYQGFSQRAKCHTDSKEIRKPHWVSVHNAQGQLGLHAEHCEVMQQGKNNLNFAYLTLYSQQIVTIHGNIVGVISNSRLKF